MVLQFIFIITILLLPNSVTAITVQDIQGIWHVKMQEGYTTNPPTGYMNDLSGLHGQFPSNLQDGECVIYPDIINNTTAHFSCSYYTNIQTDNTAVLSGDILIEDNGSKLQWVYDESTTNFVLLGDILSEADANIRTLSLKNLKLNYKTLRITAKQKSLLNIKITESLSGALKIREYADPAYRHLKWSAVYKFTSSFIILFKHHDSSDIPTQNEIPAIMPSFGPCYKLNSSCVDW